MPCRAQPDHWRPAACYFLPVLPVDDPLPALPLEPELGEVVLPPEVLPEAPELPLPEEDEPLPEALK